MFDEADLLPVAALQHLKFCERQWGLMYLEGIWAENILTAEGKTLHERVDEDTIRLDGDILIASGLRLRSLKLGLTGRADLVEFHPTDESEDIGAEISLERIVRTRKPFPVEFKHGRPKFDICDEVQLCAQALCLEEMLGVSIPNGGIFYGKPRRRSEIEFHPDLRKETTELIARLHMMTREGTTPPPRYTRACKSCSLLFHCMPKTLHGRKSASRYLDNQLAALQNDEEHKS